MNNAISTFARAQIKEGLLKCSDTQQKMFRLMYGRQSGKRSVEDAEQLTTDQVIAEVPEERLSLALSQIEATLAKK